MNRAEAAEYIKKRCFTAYPNTDDSLWDKAMVTAIKALEQPEQQWIPVTERLPNEDEIIYNGVGINGERKVSDRVCAIDSDGFIRCGYFQKSCMEHEYWGNGRKNEYSETGIATWEFGDHWDCDPNQWIVTVSESIVAWMPLPELYKAESVEVRAKKSRHRNMKANS